MPVAALGRNEGRRRPDLFSSRQAVRSRRLDQGWHGCGPAKLARSNSLIERGRLVFRHCPQLGIEDT